MTDKDSPKCCKPKCIPDKNVCSNTLSFYEQFTTASNLAILHAIVIAARFKELNLTKFNSIQLFWFIFWLEIQILFFYYGLYLFYWSFSNLQIILALIYKCIAIIVKPLSKKKGVIGGFIKFGEVLLKILLIFIVMLLISLSFLIFVVFIAYLFIFGPILLGYTKYQ